MTHDEELQHKAEKGRLNTDESVDARAYREVFNSLNTPPSFKLSESFASNVVSRLEQKQKKASSLDYILYAAGVLLMLSVVMITLYFLPISFDFGVLKNIAPLKSILIFGVLFIMVLNWVDYRFIRNRESKQS